MLTAASSAAGTAPHEIMEAHQRGSSRHGSRAQRQTSSVEQELEKARAHVRATQWAFAQSMIVDCEQFEDDDDDDDEDWDQDWDDETPASSEPGTPDWRGVLRIWTGS